MESRYIPDQFGRLVTKEGILPSRTLAKYNIPRHFQEDIIWGKNKAKQLKMIPKQQSSVGSFNYPSNYNPGYKNLGTSKIVHGGSIDRLEDIERKLHYLEFILKDYIDKEDMYWINEEYKGKYGAGIFESLGKLPWGKIFDTGSKFIPTMVDTGLKIYDKTKKPVPAVVNKTNPEMVEYLKEMAKNEPDMKLKMEYIREIKNYK
jgi:hypothetical protein